MNIVEEIEAAVRQMTPEGVGKRDFGAIIQKTALLLKRAINRPEQLARPIMAMDMMVASRKAPQVTSVSLTNLHRQADPTNPRFLARLLAAGVLSEVAADGVARFCAFVLAVTVLATRTVTRSEAMTLHLAWKIARFDQTFSVTDMISHADALREDYDVDKVSESDITGYLNNLVRSGSLNKETTGYRVVEHILLLC